MTEDLYKQIEIELDQRISEIRSLRDEFHSIQRHDKDMEIKAHKLVMELENDRLRVLNVKKSKSELKTYVIKVLRDSLVPLTFSQISELVQSEGYNTASYDLTGAIRQIVQRDPATFQKSRINVRPARISLREDVASGARQNA